MIGIIDYGMGNLHSVTKAVERLGRECFLSEDPKELKNAECLILPGVGAFKDGMDELESRGLVSFIHEWIEEGKPLLGICLGMQLLFDESEENGPTKGLSVLPGKVKKFPGGNYKVPHMGWNELIFEQTSHPVLKGLDGGHVYFVHSYFVVADRKEILIASASYGGEQVTAVAGRDNVWGTQFHPEKSSVVGMTMLKNFVDHKGGAV